MLINFSFSINLVASFLDIKSKETRFGSLSSNFGWPKLSTYHNGIGGPFLGLHRALVKDILHQITSHPIELLKKGNKCMFYAQPRFLAHPLNILSRLNFWSLGFFGQHSSFSQDVVFKCHCTYLAIFFLMSILGIEAWPQMGIGKKGNIFCNLCS